MKKTIIVDKQELQAFTIVRIEGNKLARLIEEAMDNMNYSDEVVITMETQS